MKLLRIVLILFAITPSLLHKTQAAGRGSVEHASGLRFKETDRLWTAWIDIQNEFRDKMLECYMLLDECETKLAQVPPAASVGSVSINVPYSGGEREMPVVSAIHLVSNWMMRWEISEVSETPNRSRLWLFINRSGLNSHYVGKSEGGSDDPTIDKSEPVYHFFRGIDTIPAAAVQPSFAMARSLGDKLINNIQRELRKILDKINSAIPAKPVYASLGEFKLALPDVSAVAASADGDDTIPTALYDEVIALDVYLETLMPLVAGSEEKAGELISHKRRLEAALQTILDRYPDRLLEGDKAVIDRIIPGSIWQITSFDSWSVIKDSYPAHGTNLRHQLSLKKLLLDKSTRRESGPEITKTTLDLAEKTDLNPEETMPGKTASYAENNEGFNHKRLVGCWLLLAGGYTKRNLARSLINELKEAIRGNSLVKPFKALLYYLQREFHKDILESTDAINRNIQQLLEYKALTRAFYGTDDPVYVQLVAMINEYKTHLTVLRIRKIMATLSSGDALEEYHREQARLRAAQAEAERAWLDKKAQAEAVLTTGITRITEQGDGKKAVLNELYRRASLDPAKQEAIHTIKLIVDDSTEQLRRKSRDLERTRDFVIEALSAETQGVVDRAIGAIKDVSDAEIISIQTPAARKIQSAFRGYKARKEFKVLKAEEAEREAAANAKADAFRKQKEAQRARTALQAWLEAAKKESAARDIQRVWRGKKGRDEARERKAFVEMRKEAVKAFEKDARDLFDAFDTSRLAKNLEPLALFLNTVDSSEEDEAIAEITKISSQLAADAELFVKENEAGATTHKQSIEQAEDKESLLSAVTKASEWAASSRTRRFSLLELRMRSAASEVTDVMRQFVYALSSTSDGEHKAITSEVQEQWEEAVIETNSSIDAAASAKDFYAINFKKLLSAAQRLIVMANAALELQDAVENIDLILNGDDRIPGVMLELAQIGAAEDIGALRELASSELKKVKESDAWQGKSADKNIARLATNAVKKVNDAVVEVIKKHGLEIDLSRYKKSVEKDIIDLTVAVKKAFVETSGLFKKILAAERAKDSRDQIIRLIEEHKKRILATINIIKRTSGSERIKHLQSLKQQIVIEKLGEKLQLIIDEYFAKRAMPSEKESSEAQLSKAISSLTEKLSSVNELIDYINDTTLTRMEKQAKTLMPYFKSDAKKLPTKKRAASDKKADKAVTVLEDDDDKITPGIRAKYEKLAGAQEDGETDGDYLKRVKAALSESYKKHKAKAELRSSEASTMFEDETLRPGLIEAATEESDKFSYGAAIDKDTTWLARRKSLSLTALKRSIKAAHDAVVTLAKEVQAQLTELKGDDRLTSEQRQKPNQTTTQAKEILKTQEVSTDKEEIERANETILRLKNELIELKSLLSDYITSAREDLIKHITDKKESLKKLYDEILEAGKFTPDKTETQRKAASHFDEAKIRKISTDTLANMREFVVEMDKVAGTLERINKATAGAIIYEQKEEDVKELSIRHLVRERSKMSAPTIATNAAERDIAACIDALRAIHEATVLARRSKRNTTTDITAALEQLDGKPAQKTLRSADTKNTSAILTALLNLLDKAKGITAANWYGDHVSFLVLNEDAHREAAQKALGVEVWKLLMRLSTDEQDLIDGQFKSTKLPKITQPAAPVATAGAASTADATPLTKSAPAALTSPGKASTVTAPAVDPKQIGFATTVANALATKADAFTAAKTNIARTAAWAGVFDVAGVAAAIDGLTESAHPTLITADVVGIIDALKAGVSTGGFTGIASVGTKRIPYKELYVKVKSILDKTAVPAGGAAPDKAPAPARAAAPERAPAIDEVTAIVRLFEEQAAALSATSTAGQKRTAFNAIVKALTSKYAKTGGAAAEVARKITTGLSTLDRAAVGRELQRLGIQLPARDALVGTIWDFFNAALKDAAPGGEADGDV